MSETAAPALRALTRSDAYALLGALLLHPPSPPLLAALAIGGASRAGSQRIDGHDHRYGSGDWYDADEPPVEGFDDGDEPLDDDADDDERLAEPPAVRGWRALCEAARDTDAPAAEREFDALFIAVGDPPIDPRASRYLPPAQEAAAQVALRRDLRSLGLALAANAPCSEDHLGALCESASLIARRGEPDALARFFNRHIAPWYAPCVDDLAACGDAPFYASVGAWARGFLDGEHDACTED